MLVNNEGSGFAGLKEVETGTTIDQLFRSEMGSRDFSSFTVSVNHKQVSSDYVLQAGDRVSMTPSKIEGA